MKVKLISVTNYSKELVEYIGRVSHKSDDKISRNSSDKFIKNLIKMKHYSVLEFVNVAFEIKEVSRSLTHQLVRHRLASYLQESQRYVSMSNFSYVIPDSLKDDKEILQDYKDFMNRAKSLYNKLSKKIKKEDARYVLPNAVETRIIVSANIREWRHILLLRGSIHAQWEIRYLMIEILKLLKKELSIFFFDFTIDDDKKIIRQK